MGMPKQVIKLLLNENEYKKINGEFLVCGRQSILINKTIIKDLLSSNHELLESLLDKWHGENLDINTRHGKDSIKDDVFLKTLFNINYNCIDISEYEGANIILDLNYPIPNESNSKYDFIFSGGCLDNIFNPVSFLVNTTNLLKPGGRIVHYETFSGVMGSFLGFTPEWFYGYYGINNFTDCKVYVCHQTKKGTTRVIYDTNLFSYKPQFTRKSNPDYFEAALACKGIMYVMVIAEKGYNSTSDKMPSQLQYLNKNTIDWSKMSVFYDNSLRKHIQSKIKLDNYKLPFLTDHYTYLGSNY
jgi:hypothetical protein